MFRFRKCREISNRDFIVWDVKLYALFACLHFFAIEKFAHFGCSIERVCLGMLAQCQMRFMSFSDIQLHPNLMYTC